MSIKKKLFGKLENGTEIYLFTFKQADGSEVQFTNFGAAVVSLKVPDRNGIIENVILGFDKLEDYISLCNMSGNPTLSRLTESKKFSNRWGNRIGCGEFTLDDKKYILAKNDGENHLHAGIKGFDRVVYYIIYKAYSLDSFLFYQLETT